MRRPCNTLPLPGGAAKLNIVGYATMYSDLITRLTELRRRIQALEETVHVEAGLTRVRELEEKMAQPGFWDSNEKAQEVIAEAQRTRREIDPLVEIRQSASDLLELARIGETEDDGGTLAELERETGAAEVKLDALELKAILSEPHDASNAFISIHAGAGGTDACDWTRMLARLYTRFCETQRFDVEMVDSVDGDEAGLRSIMYLVKGPYAYGFLKAEAGVHRLVRISPFGAKSLRQTSFAAVDVIPEVPDSSKEVEIGPADIRIDTFRAGGAGGQHVNKVESAVRITHIASGLVAQCQNERSQHSNKATAMRMLKAMLLREEEKKREAEYEKHYGEKGEIAFGSQIRSYTLQPTERVKDHRTGLEVGNATGVLDGAILPFIEEYLRWRKKRAKNPTSGGAAAAKFCTACGVKLLPGSKVCGGCGVKNPPSGDAAAAKFCGTCGVKLVPGSKSCGSCGAKVTG